MVEQVHQLFYNMLVKTYFKNTVFDYIDPWGRIITPIAWDIRDSYLHNF